MNALLWPLASIVALALYASLNLLGHYGRQRSACRDQSCDLAHSLNHGRKTNVR